MNIEQLQQAAFIISNLLCFSRRRNVLFSITPKLLEFTFTVRRSVRRLLNSGYRARSPAPTSLSNSLKNAYYPLNPLTRSLPK